MIQPSQRHVSIQPLTLLEHFDAVIALQHSIWGYSDLDTDSRALLVIASRFIGQLFGAFAEGRLIGMALSFHSHRPGCIHSHRVGVLPEYQNQGIGLLLKLAQRNDAIQRNIDAIQWTFDPLQTRNAHFNLMRLGGIARTYIPNLYGQTSSHLHGGLPTDRLLIEWHLNSPRVIDVLSGWKPEATGDHLQIDLPSQASRTDPQIQQRLREEFQRHLAQGYAVIAFNSDGDRNFYTLEKL